MQVARFNDFATRAAVTLVAAISVFLLIRNNGLYPMVFADEFTYSKFARLVPMSESLLPNYLYFFIYRVTNVCGDGFLGCARIINVVFLVSIAPLVYAVCRQVSGRGIALAIATLAVAGQMNSYTAYFMPECMFALAFWLCSWLTLNYKADGKLSTVAFIGLAWGASSLVKPHTLFLLPAVAVYISYVGVSITGGKLIQSIGRGVLVAASAVSVKLIVGYVIAGENGLSFFGKFYSQYANAVVHRDAAYYLNLASVSAVSFLGHAMIMVVLYSVPALSLVAFWCSVIRDRKIGACASARLNVFATLMIGTLIVVTAIFTASVSNMEPARHLHVRYYVFAIPLMAIAAVYSLRLDAFSVSLKARWILSIAALLVVFYGAFVRFAPYEVHSSTAPEVFSVLASDWVFYGTIALSAISVLVWAVSPRLAFIFYISVIAPCLAVVTFVTMNDRLMLSSVPDVYDRAAEFANAYLARPERQDVVIVGSEQEVGGLFRTLFHLDLSVTDYGIQTVATGAAYKLADLPSGKKWVLLIGQHMIVGEKLSEISGDGYSLIRAK